MEEGQTLTDGKKKKRREVFKKLLEGAFGVCVVSYICSILVLEYIEVIRFFVCRRSICLHIFGMFGWSIPSICCPFTSKGNSTFFFLFCFQKSVSNLHKSKKEIKDLPAIAVKKKVKKSSALACSNEEAGLIELFDQR